MFDEQPVKIFYVQQPISTVRTKSYRSPKYLNVRTNRVGPRPLFTCIDEIYSTPSASNPSTSALTAATTTTNSSSQVLKTIDVDESAPKWQKWTIIIIIVIVVTCIIAIIILLSVFLTR